MSLLGPYPHFNIGGRKRATLVKDKVPAERSRGNRPQYIARAKQDPEKDFMVTIGAAFPFNNGDGFVVKLSMTPTSWNGDFILVPPKADE
ncbi:hypothetical protein [Rhodoferax sp.]|uniref:hypothetical protein n=1 Tax=Rhodoferax sp. TaxID=50421 RepID=UPI00274E2043|nr:hypothetical protein [Rhodoferax sp.]